MLQMRANFEAIWHQGDYLHVIATVQGWYRPDGQALWTIGDDVSFYSPMAMITQTLKIQTATFTQDRAQGTLTQLELVAPWALLDNANYDVRDPNTVQPPAHGTINNQPATTPPAAKPFERAAPFLSSDFLG
jgi:prophage tail gpP-like protein